MSSHDSLSSFMFEFFTYTMKLIPYTRSTYLNTFPMVMLRMEMGTFALVNPSTMVTALPSSGGRRRIPSMRPVLP